MSDLVRKLRDDPTNTVNVLKLCDALDRDLTTDEVLDSYLNSCMKNSSEDLRRTSMNGLSALGIPLVYKGVKFKSMMHAFQAQKLRYTDKFNGKEDELPNAMGTFANVDLDVVNHRGRTLSGVDIVKWDADKLAIMEDIMAELIFSNKSVYDKLLAAPDDLIEDLIQAPFWGLPENNMGILWTRYRNKITSNDLDMTWTADDWTTDDFMNVLTAATDSSHADAGDDFVGNARSKRLRSSRSSQ